MFIFGEDPTGCSMNGEGEKYLKKAGFKVVMDYFMTPTAFLADLILPASLPAETGGSFTNTLRMIQQFDPVLKPKSERNSLEQLTLLLSKFGIVTSSLPGIILDDFISSFSRNEQPSKLKLTITSGNDQSRIFNYGCDAVVRQFEEEFLNSLAN